MPPNVDGFGASSLLVSSSYVFLCSHTGIICKNICLSPIRDQSEYQFLFDSETYMVSSLSFLLQVSLVSGGQSMGVRHNPLTWER